jgi:hypothetical protein
MEVAERDRSPVVPLTLVLLRVGVVLPLYREPIEFRAELRKSRSILPLPCPGHS